MTNAPVIAIHIILNDIKDKDEQKEFLETVKKENPQAYKQYRKDKETLENLELYSYKVDLDKVKERLQELKDLKEYVPSRLGFTLGTYDEPSKEIINEYEDSSYILHTIHDPNKFMDFEIIWWLKEHEEFDDLIERI